MIDSHAVALPTTYFTSALKTHSYQKAGLPHHPHTPRILLIIELSSPSSTLQYMWLEGSEGIFIYLRLKTCAYFFFFFFGSEWMLVWLHPHWPYYKRWESWRARETEGVEKRNGSAAFISAGSPSGRHAGSDVTNAVNVPVCSHRRLRRPVSSPAHLKIHRQKQFKLLSHLVFPVILRCHSARSW